MNFVDANVNAIVWHLTVVRANRRLEPRDRVVGRRIRLRAAVRNVPPAEVISHDARRVVLLAYVDAVQREMGTTRFTHPTRSTDVSVAPRHIAAASSEVMTSRQQLPSGARGHICATRRALGTADDLLHFASDHDRGSRPR